MPCKCGSGSHATSAAVNTTDIYHGNQQHSGERQRESGCDVTLGHQAFVNLGLFYSTIAQEVVKLKDRAHVADKD